MSVNDPAGEYQPPWYYPPGNGLGDPNPSLHATATSTSGWTIQTGNGAANQSIPINTTTGGGFSIHPVPINIQGPSVQMVPGTSTYWPLGSLTTTDWSKYWEEYWKNMNTSMQSVVPVDEKFIILRGDFLVKAHGKERTLNEWLNDTKYVKYVKCGTELVILRAVWDALFLFMKGDVPYADLELPEFLD